MAEEVEAGAGEERKELDLSNADVVTKYKNAAEIANSESPARGPSPLCAPVAPWYTRGTQGWCNASGCPRARNAQGSQLLLLARAGTELPCLGRVSLCLSR